MAFNLPQVFIHTWWWRASRIFLLGLSEVGSWWSEYDLSKSSRSSLVNAIPAFLFWADLAKLLTSSSPQRWKHRLRSHGSSVLHVNLCNWLCERWETCASLARGWARLVCFLLSLLCYYRRCLKREAIEYSILFYDNLVRISCVKRCKLSLAERHFSEVFMK